MMNPDADNALKITDIIPRDVWECSLLFGYLIVFPGLLMLCLNDFGNPIGVLTEKLFFLLSFILLGAIGPRACRRTIMGILCVSAVIWNVVDLFCFLQLRTQFIPSFFQLLASTDLNECRGFLRIYLWQRTNLLLLIYPAAGIGIFYLSPRRRAWMLPAATVCMVPLCIFAFQLRRGDNRVLNLYDLLDETLDEIVELKLTDEIIDSANSRLNAVCTQ